MDEHQTLSFVQAIAATLFNWEDTFLQLKAGTLDASSFESDDNALRVLASAPAFRVAWRMNREFYGRGFREYVDKIMHDTKVVQPPTHTSTWKAMMAEELASVA